MASEAAALKGAVDTPSTTSPASRSLSGGVASFARALRAWLQATQLGPDRSREVGRRTGARC
jgi:hypothetical protein